LPSTFNSSWSVLSFRACWRLFSAEAMGRKVAQGRVGRDSRTCTRTGRDIRVFGEGGILQGQLHGQAERGCSKSLVRIVTSNASRLTWHPVGYRSGPSVLFRSSPSSAGTNWDRHVQLYVFSVLRGVNIDGRLAHTCTAYLTLMRKRHDSFIQPRLHDSPSSSMS
jgi:hypothetical protein